MMHSCTFDPTADKGIQLKSGTISWKTKRKIARAYRSNPMSNLDSIRFDSS